MTTPVRIGTAVLLLFPVGLLMGMAFPLGMKLAAARAQELTPWLWGLNGAASVLASVLSVCIALTWSITRQTLKKPCSRAINDKPKA